MAHMKYKKTDMLHKTSKIGLEGIAKA